MVYPMHTPQKSEEKQMMAPYGKVSSSESSQKMNQTYLNKQIQQTSGNLF